jgi:alpha-beta hydrolase superfamily lysophospholipase
MLDKKPFSCPAKDGLILQGMSWRKPSVASKAVLLIVHGMTEHCLRYDSFASHLASNGIQVFAFDLRGHGKTTPNEEDRGFFGAKGGVDILMSDIQCVREKIQEILACDALGALPFMILGHSMGSFITSCYCKRTRAEGLDGIILSGTTALPGPVGLARGLARMQSTLMGPKSRGRLLTKLAFGGYNSRCKPKRTQKDWLSRDNEIVDAYLLEPACTFLFKAAGFYDLFSLLGEIGPRNWTDQVPEDVPVYLFCGEMDPVGNYGKGPQTLQKWFIDTGHAADLKIYPGSRHETINEINREEVYEDVLSFILQNSQRKTPLRGAMASGPGKKNRSKTNDPMTYDL